MSSKLARGVREVRVLQTIRPQRGGNVTNPYASLLVENLPHDVRSYWFSWPRALLGRYDVFHVHWIEYLARTRGWRTPIKASLFALLLVSLRVRRAAIVRTAHNIEPHIGGGRLEQRLVSWFDALPATWIVMNRETQVPVTRGVHLIPHGHYRDWYPIPSAEMPPEPNRLLLFGVLRPNKGIDELLEAVSACGHPLTMRIVGKPSGSEIRDAVLGAAARDNRISPRLGFVSDAELAEEIAKCSRVVLPYPRLHNSGALLLALSLGRAVLVPESKLASDLQDEFGTDWVVTYPGGIDAGVIEWLIDSPMPRGLPNMSGRDWSAIGRMTRDVYLQSLGAEDRLTK